jgi:hypothetical protein
VLQGAADGSEGDYRWIVHRHVISCDGLFYQSLGEASEEIKMPDINERDHLKVQVAIVKSCGI